MKRFEITKLPPYLILYIKRFTKNTFFVEKNPTVINFPVKWVFFLLFFQKFHWFYLQLRWLYPRNIDFGEFLTPEVKAQYNGKTVYDLVGNIVHDGSPDKGTYRAHVLHHPTQQW